MPETESAPAPAPRDVIVYVPGLMRSGDQAADVMAQRIARAIDRQSKTALPVFAVKPGTDEPLPGDATARRVTIVRTDQGREEPVLDVYSFEWVDALMRSDVKQSTFVRAMGVAWVAAKYFPKVLKGLRAPSKTLRQKGQVVFASALFLLLLVYLGTLVTTLAKSVIDTKRASQVASGTAKPVEKTHLAKKVDFYLQGLETVLLIATLGGVVTAGDLRAGLERGGKETRAAADYLEGIGSGSLRGRLDDVLDLILTNAAKVPIRNLHIVSFSFGSIVALDSFFPKHDDPAPRMKNVQTLVTIGCPFDFVRAYFPKYFRERTVAAEVPPRWVNIFNPDDILGSNFLDDSKGQNKARGVGANDEARPHESVVYKTGGGSDGLLSGFRAHAAYFNREDVRAIDSTEKMIKTLYGGTPMLEG